MGQLGEPEATREARSPGATRGNIGESMGLPGKPGEPGATRGTWGYQGQPANHRGIYGATRGTRGY